MIYSEGELYKLYLGDALEEMKQIDEESVDCIVTSPPYYRLRDYGIEGQIGLEKTVDEYIEKLANVFNEAKRVLKESGTMFINIGDKYDNKELLMVPERLALRLKGEGWILRNKIIWYKPNATPESAIDRFSQTYEFIFFFTKRKKYYFNLDKVRVPIKESSLLRRKSPITKFRSFSGTKFPKNTKVGEAIILANKEGIKDTKNPGDLWTIATNKVSTQHLAYFPPKLCEMCIKAGCPEGGIVLDMFNGSGTTGVVAMGLGMRYIGIDINKTYLDETKERFRQELGFLLNQNY